MKKQITRIFSLALTAALVMGVLCIQASAASATLTDGYGRTVTISDVASEKEVELYGKSQKLFEVQAGVSLTGTDKYGNPVKFYFTPAKLDGDTLSQDEARAAEVYGTSPPGMGTQTTTADKAGTWIVSMDVMGGEVIFFGLQVAGEATEPTTPTEPTEPTTPTAPTGGTAFSDVDAGAYYYDAVQWAVEKGVTSGTTATTFSPNNTCTTSQIITFLWRANGSPEPTAANPFTDVAESNYYYKAALWAYEKGMVNGSSFNGSTPCTRSQTVTYLWTMEGNWPMEPNTAFQDVDSNAPYAQAVAWAVDLGITAGTTENTFSPDSTCTRAQIMAFLYRWDTLPQGLGG